MLAFELDEEFYLRVKHNFKLYVLLSSKQNNWREEDILDTIFGLNGYKSHKTVKYGKNSSHIHVKFQEENLAKEAIKFLNEMNSDLTAVLTDAMLRDWFNYEMKSGFGPPCTLTIVDIIGHPPLALNFLTSNILDSIFKDFGNPYLLPYTAALNKPHVQVLFNSMTEALATSMAFGEWYEVNKKVDSFFYRVRINPSDKEAMLITNSGGTPAEAFKLDYFLILRNEVPQSSKKPECNLKQNKIPQAKESVQSKGKQRVRRQKHAPVISVENQSNLSSQICHRTPILCLPVIAPFIDFPQVITATSGPYGGNFAIPILNFQQSCSLQARTIVASDVSEMEIRSEIQYCSAERVECTSDFDQQLSISLEEPLTNSIENSVPNEFVPSKFVPRGKCKKKAVKTNTRVFERST